MIRLVIDLGHGGRDPGAVGKGSTKESDVVLSIGKYLNDMLKVNNLEVKFTRLSDKYLSLDERVKIANDFNADYFLSIHINSTNDASVRGVEVWQYDDSNKSVNKFSSDLAVDISELLKIRNRGLKLSKNLYVLKHTKMKAMLVEVDFISNLDCEKQLVDDTFIKNIAMAIRDNLFKLCNINNATGIMYKVCIGSYRDQENAIDTMNLAKSKGFNDAYIINNEVTV